MRSSLAKLSWLVTWHIRDETYRKALAKLVNFQQRIPLAVHWRREQPPLLMDSVIGLGAAENLRPK